MEKKLIVIEGLDGGGKTTQIELIKKVYPDFRYITFPNYDSPSGKIIKSYLNGDYSEESGYVSAYTASCFYAVDRYTSYKTDWEKDIKAGKIVVSARYVSSNAMYQMTKLSEEKWEEYLNWLYDMEYNKFGMPKPYATLFLDMPTDISRKLLLKRYGGDEKKLDIHESNLMYMDECRKALAEGERIEISKVGSIIPEVKVHEGGEPLSVDRIHQTIILKIKELLE